MTVPWSGAIGANLVHFTGEDGRARWSHMVRDLTRLKKITRQLVASQTVVDDVFIIYGAWTRNDIVRRVMLLLLLLLLIVISNKYAVKIGISWVGWRYSLRASGRCVWLPPASNLQRQIYAYLMSVNWNKWDLYRGLYESECVDIALESVDSRWRSTDSVSISFNFSQCRIMNWIERALRLIGMLQNVLLK